MVLLVALWAAPAQAGRGTSLLKYVPDDVEMVMSLDISGARSTPLFRRSLEILKVEAKDIWQTLRDAKFDLAKDLDTLLVAGSYSGGQATERFVAVFEGRLSGLQTIFHHNPVTLHRGVAVRVDAAKDMASLVVDKRLIVCSTSMLDDVVATILRKRVSARTSRRATSLRSGLAGLDPRGDAWMVITGAAIKEALPAGLKLSWMGVWAATNKGVAVELRAGTDSEAAAAEISTLLVGQIGAVKQLLASQGFDSMAESFEAKTTGPVVGVSLLMSEEEVTKVLRLVSRQAAEEAEVKSP